MQMLRPTIGIKTRSPIFSICVFRTGSELFVNWEVAALQRRRTTLVCGAVRRGRRGGGGARGPSRAGGCCCGRRTDCELTETAGARRVADVAPPLAAGTEFSFVRSLRLRRPVQKKSATEEGLKRVANFVSRVPQTQSFGILDFAPVAPQQFVGVPTEAESSRAIFPAAAVARFVTRRRKMTSKSVDWIGYLAAALMALSCLQGRRFTHCCHDYDETFIHYKMPISLKEILF